MLIVSCSFHAYKSVAPLKQNDQGDIGRPFLEFPRLQKRGPIEALCVGHEALAASMFPRLQKRGPIEAWLLC